jgi:hypothetical protein
VRLALSAVLLAACGRVGFDGSGEGERDPDRAAAYGSVVLGDGPSAYFRFAETSGPDAVSEVGTARGTYEGDFQFGAIGAVGDATVVYDGATTLIDLGDTFRFAGTAPYTFELWAFPYAIDDHTLFLVQRRSSTGDGYAFYIGKDYALFAREAASTEFGYVDTGEALPLNTWTYLVATYDGTIARLFENAVEVSANTGGDAAGPIPDASGTLVLGDHVPAQFFKLDGRLDELAIYDYALDPARIRAHYDAAR